MTLLNNFLAFIRFVALDRGLTLLARVTAVAGGIEIPPYFRAHSLNFRRRVEPRQNSYCSSRNATATTATGGAAGGTLASDRPASPATPLKSTNIEEWGVPVDLNYLFPQHDHRSNNLCG